MNEENSSMDNDQNRYSDSERLPQDLLATAQRYAAQPMPRPTSEQTRHLVERMLAEQPMPARTDRPARQGTVLAAVRVARWRIRLMSVWFWIACVVLLIAVNVISVVNRTPAGMVALVMLLPLTAVLGLAQASRTPSHGLREVETAAPVSPITVIAASALAIVGLDCAFGVTATALLALLSWAPFAALLIAWLSPTLFLAAISLPIALRWGTISAAIVGAGPWVALAFVAAILPGNSVVDIFSPPRDALSVALHLVAASIGAAGLLFLLHDSAWRRALIRPTM